MLFSATQTTDVEIVSLTADLSFPVMRSNGSKATQKVELKDARAQHSRNPSLSPVSFAGTVVARGKSVDLLIEEQLLSEEYLYVPDPPKLSKSSASAAGPVRKSSLLGSAAADLAQPAKSTFQLVVVVVYKTVGGGVGADCVDDGLGAAPGGDAASSAENAAAAAAAAAAGANNNNPAAAAATAATATTTTTTRERRLERRFKFGVRKPFQERCAALIASIQHPKHTAHHTTE